MALYSVAYGGDFATRAVWYKELPETIHTIPLDKVAHSQLFAQTRKAMIQYMHANPSACGVTAVHAGLGLRHWIMRTQFELQGCHSFQVDCSQLLEMYNPQLVQALGKEQGFSGSSWNDMHQVKLRSPLCMEEQHELDMQMHIRIAFFTPDQRLHAIDLFRNDAVCAQHFLSLFDGVHLCANTQSIRPIVQVPDPHDGL